MFVTSVTGAAMNTVSLLPGNPDWVFIPFSSLLLPKAILTEFRLTSLLLPGGRNTQAI